MRTFLIALLVVQVVLIICGVIQLAHGNIGNGLFNIILNLVFGLLNLRNIKKIN
jgi:hypothetical protein